MNSHLAPVEINIAQDWDFNLAITTEESGVFNLDLSKNGENFIIKGRLGENNSFTIDLTDGNETTMIQLSHRPIEAFIQNCVRLNLQRVLMMDLPIKEFEGENQTETAEKVKDWIFGPEEESQNQAFELGRNRIDFKMTKDILNFKQEIYSEDNGHIIVKRSVNDNDFVMFDLTEGKVTTNMQENQLNAVMEEWDMLMLTVILKVFTGLNLLKSLLISDE